MKIGKLKLEQDGLKGMTVSFIKTEIKDGLSFQNEYQVKYKSPIHRELKNLIQSLGKYVIDICALNEDSEVVVTGITANDNQFLITAKSYVLENSVISVNTPNIKAGMYDAFEAIQKIIDEIYKEVDVYATKKKAIDKKQFVMDLFGKDADALNSIDLNDDEAVTKAMVEFLEKKGCIILEQEPNLSVEHSEKKGETLEPVAKAG